MRILFLLLMLCLSNFSLANSGESLTVDELKNTGYTQLTGLQIIALLNQQRVAVRDIATDAVYISVRNKNGSLDNRKIENDKSPSSKYLFDTELLARAPLLSKNAKYEVLGDELISKDGIRTYKIKFYDALYLDASAKYWITGKLQ